MKRIQTLVFIFLAGLGALQAQTTSYKAHAIFIFSIAKYSQWPASENGEFIITVLGKSKLFNELDAGKANHTIAGMKVSVLLAEDISQIKDSNMIVVADGKSGALSDLIKSTSHQPVMIVTEREGLTKKGASVSFFVNDQGKLNFDLNMTEMSKRSLSMSKSLTSLAASIL